MANHDHGNDGRFIRTEQHAENDAKAVRLRAQGASFPAIARALGYSGPGSAYKAVQRALAAIPAPEVEELRALQGEALAVIEVEAWRVVSGTHYKVSNSGRVVADPVTGEPLHDPAPKVAALGVLLRASERRAKLFGLDMPARAQVEVALTGQELSAALDVEITRLRAEIEREEHEQRRPPQWLPDLYE